MRQAIAVFAAMGLFVLCTAGCGGTNPPSESGGDTQTGGDQPLVDGGLPADASGDAGHDGGDRDAAQGGDDQLRDGGGGDTAQGGDDEDTDGGIDTAPPETTINAGPPAVADTGLARFVFSCSERDCTYECRLDSGGFEPCASPKEYVSLSNGTHTFEVRAIDRAGNIDTTPANFTWAVDTAAPETTINAQPKKLSNSAVAEFAFSCSEAACRFACRLDDGVVTECTSPQQYTGLTEGVHTFMVTAADSAGNMDASPALYSWVVDTAAPDTSISGMPDNPSKKAAARFTFACSEGACTFECVLDGGSLEVCASPKDYAALTDGSHTFTVRATDAAGNTDTTPATYTWAIDTVVPDTTITAKPVNPTGVATASFAFTCTKALCGFECKLDGGGYGACTSPAVYSGLADGIHSFEVRASDTAGNIDPSPAVFAWIVDASAPDTILGAMPPNPARSAVADFSFTCSEGACSYECRLDGGSFQTCASPKEYTGLSEGGHVFDVRAIDPAGNADPTPASHIWTVDTVVPDTSITAKPSNPSNQATATFSFTCSDALCSFECRLDSGSFATCTSVKMYTGLTDGLHTFEVRAVDSNGNADQSPAIWAWSIDTTPPRTTIVSKPPDPTNSRAAAFELGCDEPGCTLECKMDAGAFVACKSPGTYSNLADGAHTFAARSLDLLGNVEQTPATYTWHIDGTPPETQITATPVDPSDSPDAQFKFACSKTGCTYECSMDSGTFAVCASPADYHWLVNGPHTFQVRATDALGNVDPTPAEYTWTVNVVVLRVEWITPPPAVMESGVEYQTRYWVSGGIDAYHFIECSLDGVNWDQYYCGSWGEQYGMGEFGRKISQFACTLTTIYARVYARIWKESGGADGGTDGGDTGSGGVEEYVIYSDVVSSTVNPPPGNMLRVGATSLTFSGASGGSNPPSQHLDISEACGNSIAWSANDDATWLTVTPGSGTTPGNAMVDIDTAGLTAGTYTATITINSGGAINSPFAVPVVLKVGDVGVSWITPPPGTVESGTVYDVEYRVSGGIDAYHFIECSLDGEYWDQYYCGSYGEQYGVGDFKRTVSQFVCATTTMYARVYARIWKESGGADGGMDGGGDAGGGGVEEYVIYSDVVSSTVNPPPGNMLRVGATSLTFSGASGGSNPPSQQLRIDEACGSSIAWSANDDATWLTVTPGSGTTTVYAKVDVNTAGLTAGTYTATITISSGGAINSPVTVPVVLKVGDVGVSWITPPPGTMESGTVYDVEYRVSGGQDAYHFIECSLDGEYWDQYYCGSYGEQYGVGDFKRTASQFVCATTTIYARVYARIWKESGGEDGGVDDGGDAGGGGVEEYVIYSDVVSSTVNPPPGNMLAVNSSGLTFSGVAGGGNPPPQQLDINEACGNSISWSAGDDAAWLTEDPSSGTTSTSMTVTVDSTGLSDGNYKATITITSGGATNSPIDVPVTLKLSP